MGPMSQAFALVFLAELGDKTQLVVLALASRCMMQTVFVGDPGANLLMSLGVVSHGGSPEGRYRKSSACPSGS
jgi:putative Ca2+/H+ antiporter (TMEM165/GDT1 family)